VTKPLRAQPEAAAELDQAARSYEQRRPGLGHRFIASTDATLDRIQRFPAAGAPVPAYWIERGDTGGGA
jgi:hypothetical protein